MNAMIIKRGFNNRVWMVITSILFLSGLDMVVPISVSAQPTMKDSLDVRIDSLTTVKAGLDSIVGSIENEIKRLRSIKITRDFNLAQQQARSALELLRPPVVKTDVNSKISERVGFEGGILDVPSGAPVTVLGFENGFVVALYDSLFGYMTVNAFPSRSFNGTKTVSEMERESRLNANGPTTPIYINTRLRWAERLLARDRKDRNQEADDTAKREQANAALLAEQKKLLTKRFGAQTAQKILNGKAWIGMTAEMARESWGSPTDINRTTTAAGTREQWVYGPTTYLYFDKGLLTAIQN